MVRERPTDYLFVYPVALVGPAGVADVRKLWRLLDGVGRTQGRVSILLDVTEAEGPVPDDIEQRPLAVPSAVVRAAVVGAGAWRAWAASWLSTLVLAPVETFGATEAGRALRYARSFAHDDATHSLETPVP
ncbi:hypothetical protein B1759_16255 [Rubrivirga sp. SAORIC476]|jgi:hypothetical protein|uniref:STAS/SEC14 domain-containing protein n=1 Tax=Rubrivirga sp. SAORIC476 TaxID=1961794 RepID=UPI000BA9192F|nr:STAS/SEC14 domain-containing protein [Rubrivirga sp. SAORIC476]MAS55226.1 hypothetical protein [Pimelobacter sp.]PAP78983.1 hypothetical protein B1759_16255 [Rubrivirga sp. SAORIC476]